MQLDQCIGYPVERRDVEKSTDLSSRWAERCYKAHTRPDQASSASCRAACTWTCA